MSSEHHHHHWASDAEPLPRGSGAGKLLFFDAFSGIAGDMTIAALLDLGVPFGVVEEAVEPLGLAGVHVRAEPERVGAIGAHRFSVDIDAPQPERTHADIDRLLASASLDSSLSASAEPASHELGAPSSPLGFRRRAAATRFGSG